MDELLGRLHKAEGSWHGGGKPQTGAPFTADLFVSKVAAGRGVTLSYQAIDASGQVIHDELLLVGPHAMGRVALWTLGNEVLEHRLRRTDGDTMWVFAFGLRDDLEGFRQEVTLSFNRDGTFAIQHGYGLPGQEFRDGSRATFRQGARAGLLS